MKLLGLSGSLRAVSTNTALLRAMQHEMPLGCRLDLHDQLGGLPIYNPDNEGERTPAAAARWNEAVCAADGLVISCPEYAHGIPGGLKNALDWLVSGPAAVGKPVMLVHASHRSLVSREALREVLRTMSFRIFAAPELEVPLLGKKLAEYATVLDDAKWRQAIANCLAGFVQFIRQD
ncbi:NADPH-dependent FMN reductase [Mesorhizobium sp. LHD-90]|uniref:NADPH-dependent FMN reductase n=1 Tax=Mesorhizobium sp. LHD-90 TaxID=3071414 RepID=UPI0027DF5774|nr:NADPH-dependent FMN reductase [Mesorhizobium sp. LHD-90]MDQ6437057.1 NADPH-dependent FMN reductase [Mesorhizobium sp. LHD-90]